MNHTQHLQKAESNAKYVKTIKDCDFYDWIIVACFYTELHYISSFLRDKGGYEGTLNHGLRCELLRRYSRKGASHYQEFMKLKILYDKIGAHIDAVRYETSSNCKAKFRSTEIADFIEDALNNVPSIIGCTPIE
ncbi:MAG: hypothetical protein Q7J68_04020 [Thermoplasmata archaeon]|nr:hypothetical protein [Thermoplasmata archaeon]